MGRIVTHAGRLHGVRARCCRLLRFTLQCTDECRSQKHRNYLFLLMHMKIMHYARFFHAVIAMACMMAFAIATHAQEYPSRPVRWVLGFAPGGSPDSVARIITPQITAQLGQSMVLDNRPGANGILAAAA